jgi:hypothetical protein
LKQANSVKQIKRIIKVSKVFSSHLESKPPEFHRIPYVVFSKDVSDPFKTVEFLDKMKETNSLNAWDLPDVIFGYRNWLIYHAPDVAIVRSIIISTHMIAHPERHIWFSIQAMIL